MPPPDTRLWVAAETAGVPALRLPTAGDWFISPPPPPPPAWRAWAREATPYLLIVAIWGAAQVAAWAYQARISLSSTGYYATPKITWDRVQGRGRPFLYFAYGAAVTEVVIDTLTGENRILRADLLHDTGSPLNAALDIGQIEGAYVQGAGWLTTEELVWDGKGDLKTHAPSTYKIPACGDQPRVFNVALWDQPNREDTVGRSKAVGEPPFMLGISAFLALSDAVAAVGGRYPHLNAPATAERILAAVRAQSDG